MSTGLDESVNMYMINMKYNFIIKYHKKKFKIHTGNNNKSSFYPRSFSEK